MQTYELHLAAKSAASTTADEWTSDVSLLPRTGMYSWFDLNCKFVFRKHFMARGCLAYGNPHSVGYPVFQLIGTGILDHGGDLCPTQTNTFLKFP